MRLEELVETSKGRGDPRPAGGLEGRLCGNSGVKVHFGFWPVHSVQPSTVLNAVADENETCLPFVKKCVGD